MVSQWTRAALIPLQVIQKINLNTTVRSLSQEYPVVRNLHNLESLTPYTI
jgi:hypothetical protein